MHDDNKNNKNIIIHTGDFAQLRKAHGCYVDKTGFLVELLRDPTDPTHFCSHAAATLFTRPRGFGKTLIMSMMAEFFDIRKDSRELFQGLKAAEHENLLRDWMNQYPVLFLGLGDIEPHSFDKDMRAKVSALCAQHEDVLENKDINDSRRRWFRELLEGTADNVDLRGSLHTLCSILSKHYGKKPILLVDDYDAPLFRAAGHEKYEKISNFMDGFFGEALKTNHYLKFGILAGTLPVTRENRVAINNLNYNCIDDGWYWDFFGFTQDEVDQLLARAGHLEKRDQFNEWYGGYRIGELENIYCPLSVMQYLSDLQQNPQALPESYWTNTNDKSLTEGFTENIHASKLENMAILWAGNSVTVIIEDMFYYNEIYSNNNFWTILYLTGYLTVVNDRKSETNSNVSYWHKVKSVAIPNRDVQAAFEHKTRALFEEILPDDQKSVFFDMFWKADAQGLEKPLNERIVSRACIGYYGVRLVHALLVGIFHPKYRVLSNRKVELGIYEFIVHDKDSRSAAIIEVKRAHWKEDLAKCAQTSLEHIADRKYDERLKADGCKRILHWGMAFDGDSNKIAARIATSV